MNLKINFRKKWALLALLCCAVLGACDKVSEFEDYPELIYGEWYCDTEYVDGILVTEENSGDNFAYYDPLYYTFDRPNIAYHVVSGTASTSYTWYFSIFKNYLVFAQGDYVRRCEILELTETNMTLKMQYADEEISIQYYVRTDDGYSGGDLGDGNEDDFDDAIE